MSTTKDFLIFLYRSRKLLRPKSMNLH